MSPRLRRLINGRKQAFNAALNHIKQNPDFAAAQLRIYREEMELLESLSGRTAPIKILDIRSGAHLELVTDMASHEAFSVAVNEFGRMAWEQLTGHPIWMVAPDSDDEYYGAIRTRVKYWISEGYGRLTPETVDPHARETKTDSSRRSQIEAILATKGWSVNDWSTNAKVAHATAMD
jgi:hypothetical protein